MTLAEFLRVEHIGFAAFVDRARPALAPLMSYVLPLWPSISERQFLEQVHRALPSALNVSLAEIISSCASRVLDAEMHDVKIESTHRPVIDILSNGQLIARVELQASVTCVLCGVSRDPSGDAIATTGEAMVSAVLRRGVSPLHEEEPRPVAISRLVRFGRLPGGV